MSNVWEKVIAEEYVKAYKLDDESYLTDFELNEDGFIHIFKKINDKSKVIRAKKSEYKKYFRRKTFLKMLVLKIQLVEDAYVSKYFFVLAEEENIYDEKIKKMNEKIENEILKTKELNDLKINVRGKINKIRTKLDNLDIEEIDNLNNLDDFLKNILENIENRDFNLITKTDKIFKAMEEKKQNKIKLLKEQIDLILLDEKNISVVDLCKKLNVNRKTFYNLKLNEYIK